MTFALPNMADKHTSTPTKGVFSCGNHLGVAPITSHFYLRTWPPLKAKGAGKRLAHAQTKIRCFLILKEQATLKISNKVCHCSFLGPHRAVCPPNLTDTHSLSARESSPKPESAKWAHQAIGPGPGQRQA